LATQEKITHKKMSTLRHRYAYRLAKLPLNWHVGKQNSADGSNSKHQSRGHGRNISIPLKISLRNEG
jgi:hypothetical protein